MAHLKICRLKESVVKKRHRMEIRKQGEAGAWSEGWGKIDRRGICGSGSRPKVAGAGEERVPLRPSQSGLDLPKK